MDMKVIFGILIPFIGTIIGAACVYVMKKEINKKLEIIIYGFAAGVMMAALIWSLIMPAIESSSVVPVVIGLIIGVGIFYLIDLCVNKKRSFLLLFFSKCSK
jgi:ZIP family zinc transporter